MVDVGEPVRGDLENVGIELDHLDRLDLRMQADRVTGPPGSEADLEDRSGRRVEADRQMGLELLGAPAGPGWSRRRSRH